MVPMVLCAFAMIIYFTNFLYVRCILSQDCYVLAFRSVSGVNDNMPEDPGGYVMAKSGIVAGKKYFGCGSPFFRAVCSGKTIEVSGHTEVNHAMTGCFSGLRDNGWDIDVSQKARKREYAKHIRTVKRLKDLGTKESENGL